MSIGDKKAGALPLDPAHLFKSLSEKKSSEISEFGKEECSFLKKRTKRLLPLRLRKGLGYD
jgi:hypothetical protein